MTGELPPEQQGLRQRGAIRSPANLAGGLFLLVLGAIGFLGTLGIDLGTLSEFGAGMVPRAVALLVMASGALIVASAFIEDGPRLDRWSLRGLVCILGAVVAFGLTLRGFDLGLVRVPALGLVIAGPLTVAIAALADRDTRPVEIAAFAIGLTALCIFLFRFVLRLPIPLAPWLIGY